MAKDTKDRIIEAALDMFSKNGYSGTNTRELAASLGLAKSSLYRHFESKEEIMDAVVEKMNQSYEEHFGSAEKPVRIPESIEEFREMTMGMVNYTIRDENLIKTRKLLLIEQFRDEKLKALATSHFNVEVSSRFELVFGAMMDRGLFKKDDPKMMALMYSSSVSSLIHLSDREPEKTDDIVGKIEEFVDYFISVFGVERR